MAFCVKTNLDRHIWTHTGEKPYQCDRCKKPFRQKSALNVHKLTHSGVKPHKCDYCEKAFHKRLKLIEHTRTHTGEKHYKCDGSFTPKPHLQKHRLTHCRETICI